MRHLDRAAVAAPECLDGFEYKADAWGDFGGECKKATRAQLAEMQGIPGVTSAAGAKEHGVRCAYCEGPIYTDGHIEHFRRRAHFPELTFEWTNFFLACGSTKHCGHFKDGNSNPLYVADDLVKPDIDDPAEFLFFSSTGGVHPQHQLDAENTHRAAETIRVFNLDEPGLAHRRKKSASSFLDKYESLRAQLDDLDDGEPDTQAFIDQLREEFVLEEFEAVSREPYSAVIRQLMRL